MLAATFLGGSDSDLIKDLVVDPNGSVWVAGETLSHNPPIPGTACGAEGTKGFVVALSSILTDVLRGECLRSGPVEGLARGGFPPFVALEQLVRLRAGLPDSEAPTALRGALAQMQRFLRGVEQERDAIDEASGLGTAEGLIVQGEALVEGLQALLDRGPGARAPRGGRAPGP